MSKKIAHFLILLMVTMTIVSCGDSSDNNKKESKTFSVSGTATN